MDNVGSNPTEGAQFLNRQTNEPSTRSATGLSTLFRNFVEYSAIHPTYTDSPVIQRRQGPSGRALPGNELGRYPSGQGN